MDCTPQLTPVAEPIREEGPLRVAPSLPYLPALDGLRALAVISVLFYHANPVWLPGGFLGVELFFVISGYLITSLLLSEWSLTARIDLKAFWLRRARRLFPALITVLTGVIAYALLFLPDEVAGMRGDVLSTIGYVNNWYQVFSHRSYFEEIGRPSLLRHMWSLAVEEQFYLVWPLLFSVLLGRCRLKTVFWILLAGAIVSGLTMAILYQPNVDPSRVYFGTDTRAAGLLIGAALALVWRPGVGAGSLNSTLLDTVGGFALATLIVCLGLIHEFQPLLYRGGFTLVGLATAELIAVAVHGQARWIPKLLSWAPLRWIGLRSYGIYLWHFPVLTLTRPQLDVPLDGAGLLAARFLVTFGLAELSYRFIETPIRHGALATAWKAGRAAPDKARPTWVTRWALIGPLGLLLGLWSFLGVCLGTAQKPPPPSYLTHPSAPATSEPGTASTHSNTQPASPWDLTLTMPAAIHAGSQSPPPIPTLRTAGPSRYPGMDLGAPNGNGNGNGITGIGDSVMEGVAGELKRILGTNVIVSADQGRLPWNTPAIVRALHARGQLQPVVILHIGNNGYFSPQVFGEIMRELKDARRVVVVNVKAPRRWESLNNSMLAAAVKAYPQAVLVDWHGATADQPRIFWKDGIHLRPEGVKIYANMVAQAAVAH